jgi:hypothetical protein
VTHAANHLLDACLMFSRSITQLGGSVHKHIRQQTRSFVFRNFAQVASSGASSSTKKWH